MKEVVFANHEWTIDCQYKHYCPTCEYVDFCEHAIPCSSCISSGSKSLMCYWKEKEEKPVEKEIHNCENCKNVYDTSDDEPCIFCSFGRTDNWEPMEEIKEEEKVMEPKVLHTYILKVNKAYTDYYVVKDYSLENAINNFDDTFDYKATDTDKKETIFGESVKIANKEDVPFLNKRCLILDTEEVIKAQINEDSWRKK